MTHKLIGLLDLPGETSFGMVPILVHDSISDSNVAYGISSGSKPLLLPSSVTLEEFLLVNCRGVEKWNQTFVEPPHGLVATWLGSAFYDSCGQLSAPIPQIPRVFVMTDTNQFDTRTPGGLFWIESSQESYQRLDLWTRTAAIMACKLNSHPMASLMHQCLPDRVETHSAIWHTAPDRTHQERETKWFMRTWYKSREPELTADVLEERLYEASQKLLNGEHL